MSRRRPVPPPASAGVGAALKHLASTASTIKKIIAAVIAGLALLGMILTGITKYAPWAWASEVNRRQTAIETKIDALSTVVLEGQIADMEARIATLEAKQRTASGLTASEADYLRSLNRRANALRQQLDAVTRATKP